MSFPLWSRSQDEADARANYTRTFEDSRSVTPLPSQREFWKPTPAPRFPLPPDPIGLPQISRVAGIIFSGTVTSVSRVSASNSDAQAVAVTFRVEHAIRGVNAGRELTVFQWIGLWSSGQRYRIGERVLLFLYPPSKLGLTSCVGGSMGRFAIDAVGRVVLSEEHLDAFGADPVLGGKSRVSVRDFAQAVRRARGEE